MIYASPNSPGAKLAFKAAYDNFIDGKFVAPVEGPVLRRHHADQRQGLHPGRALGRRRHRTRARRRPRRRRASGPPPRPAERANVLLKIADRIEQNLELLAYAETVDNGKPIRETLNADIPLAVDHFRYFAGCLRAQEGALSEIDDNTIAYHFHEPLGVVGQIIPWNFPILMAAWKLAPALGAGNCVVLKPAESDADQHPGADRADRRPAAAGRAQHRQRLRPRSRHAAGAQQAHRQDRLHRLHRHRPRDRAGRGHQPDPGHAGTRRQEPERLLRRRAGGRRRLPRQGHRRPGAVRLQPGRGLHLPEPRADPGIDLRPVHRRARSSAWRPSSRAARWTPTR